MKSRVEKISFFAVILVVVACAAQQAAQWKVHDESRPHPPVVRPGATDSDPPSDAIVLFDGNPVYPDPLALWRLAEREGVTVFGTSAKYIAALVKAVLSAPT